MNALHDQPSIEHLPHDLAMLSVAVLGTWHRFSAGSCQGWCFQAMGAPSFVLHWIESHEPFLGHGSAVMRAITEWARTDRLTGYLVCDPDLAEWYARFGWERISTFMVEWLPDHPATEMRLVGGPENPFAFPTPVG